MAEKARATMISFKGIEANYGTAKAAVRSAGDIVLVKRGVVRAVVIRCPSGCGDDIVVNLDPRTGPAWRLYRGRRGITLYPSVWRDSGCGSHFIVWHGKIFWCDFDYLEDEEDQGLDVRVLAVLGPTLAHYQDLSDGVGETPWSVLLACRRLVKRGIAREGSGKMKGAFATVAPMA